MWNKLSQINKAWVAGVVSFVCTYVLLFFFGIDVSADLQATIASAIAALIGGIVTWAVPNAKAPVETQTLVYPPTGPPPDDYDWTKDTGPVDAVQPGDGGPR